MNKIRLETEIKKNNNDLTDVQYKPIFIPFFQTLVKIQRMNVDIF